jgi:hypothetical protein
VSAVPSSPEWIGEGLLQPVRSSRSRAPDYHGKLTIEGKAHRVELWWVQDGEGYDCLGFSPKSTRGGVLWPSKKRAITDGSDYFGVAWFGKREHRLRGWKAEADALLVRVKRD